MPEKHVFEYAVIRIMPRVERSEFVNTGVILYCKSQSFLKSIIQINENRLTALFPDIDLVEIRNHLFAFGDICSGNSQTSPIALLDTASRFRWLTARRSTIIQCSEVHPGICHSSSDMLQNLFDKLVYM